MEICDIDRLPAPIVDAVHNLYRQILALVYLHLTVLKSRQYIRDGHRRHALVLEATSKKHKRLAYDEHWLTNYCVEWCW